MSVPEEPGGPYGSPLPCFCDGNTGDFYLKRHPNGSKKGKNGRKSEHNFVKKKNETSQSFGRFRRDLLRVYQNAHEAHGLQTTIRNTPT